MVRVKMIHHVNIPIRDRQRTREWYQEVLGAEFLDRGPELNKRQLQLRIGTGEMHFSDAPDLTQAPRVHFAVEVDDWDEMLARLEDLGVPHSRSSGANLGPARTPEDDDFQGRREDNNEHFTYINDPDGNLIELVYHPLGLVDSDGAEVELADASKGLRWRQVPGFVKSS